MQFTVIDNQQDLHKTMKHKHVAHWPSVLEA
jgi:hypothetical protein